MRPQSLEARPRKQKAALGTDRRRLEPARRVRGCAACAALRSTQPSRSCCSSPADGTPANRPAGLSARPSHPPSCRLWRRLWRRCRGRAPAPPLSTLPRPDEGKLRTEDERNTTATPQKRRPEALQRRGSTKADCSELPVLPGRRRRRVTAASRPGAHRPRPPRFDP